MKTILTLAAFLCITSLFAQKEVYFKINHKIGAAAYSNSATGQNNQGDQFQVDRLDYYISRITLTFDGGKDTVLEDKYILAKIDQGVNEHLGSFNISNLESVSFGIGVDKSRNHDDPATFPSTHPLSFQSPSMHWGWTAGYRFAAMEGRTGAAMDQNWQLHALGDVNYGYATVNTSGTITGNDLIIDIDADYSKALNGVGVDGSLNYHGEAQQAPQFLQNFHNEVFSEASGSVSLSERKLNNISLYPNPANGKSILEINSEVQDGTVLYISDISGKIIRKEELSTATKSVSIDIAISGLYLVKLSSPDGNDFEERLLIQTY